MCIIKTYKALESIPRVFDTIQVLTSQNMNIEHVAINKYQELSSLKHFWMILHQHSDYPGYKCPRNILGLDNTFRKLAYCRLFRPPGKLLIPWGRLFSPGILLRPCGNVLIPWGRVILCWGLRGLKEALAAEFAMWGRCWGATVRGFCCCWGCALPWPM